MVVERSSYESGPLARMEWIKVLGASCWAGRIWPRSFPSRPRGSKPCPGRPSTGKTGAFFSITANNLANVRKGGDYVSQMIGLAGGRLRLCRPDRPGGSNLSTMNLPLEDFYAGARDADFLIYNSTIEGVVSTTDELIAKCSLLADFRAVQNGDVWCTSQSFFQQSMSLADFIQEMHRVFRTGERPGRPAVLQMTPRSTVRRRFHDHPENVSSSLTPPRCGACGAVAASTCSGAALP